MTSKEKLIERAQRVQVAAEAAGYRAQLVLCENGIEFSALDAEEYTSVFRISLTYGCGDDLQITILNGLISHLTFRSKKEGGEA